MSAETSMSSVDSRAYVGEIVIYHLFPLFGTVKFALYISGRHIIAEIVDEGIGYI